MAENCIVSHQLFICMLLRAHFLRILTLNPVFESRYKLLQYLPKNYFRLPCLHYKWKHIAMILHQTEIYSMLSTLVT